MEKDENCLAESTRMSVRQNLLEKRNQLARDLMPDEDAVADKENQPENKSIRRAFGGVMIVITEPPLSPQREESMATKNENDDVLPKTAEDKRENMTDDKKEPTNKSEKESVQKRNLRDIIGGFGKKKAIKAVTIKNRHQVVSNSLL